MRGLTWALAIAALAAAGVAVLVGARRGAVDRQLDAELATALDRGGIADLGRAQALGRRLVLGAGGGRAEAAALAFTDARLAVDYGLPTAAEAEEILSRFGLPDARRDGPATMAASARALLAARAGDRERAARIATLAAAAHPGTPHPLYALGRTRALDGDLVGAERAFDAAIVVAPTFLPARVARAEVLFDAGRPEPARAALQSVLAESPNDLAGHLLLAEASPTPPTPDICVTAPWRPPVIEARCALLRAARARRRGAKPEAREAAELAARTEPDEPRLLARTALLLAHLGAIDRAATLLARARHLASPNTPALAWAAAAISLGRGRAALLPTTSPPDSETALLVARSALATGGLTALITALKALGPTTDADLTFLFHLAHVGHQDSLPTSDPFAAYLAGVAAQLAGKLPAAALDYAHALSGHGDACRAAGEYIAALRAEKRPPPASAFASLRAENVRCINLP